MDSPEKLERVNVRERRMAILEAALQTEGKVRTRDLAEQLGVGQNLLSYDINYLTSLGLITRGHGWIMRKQSTVRDLFSGTEFAVRQEEHVAEKKALARYLTTTIADGVQVIIDAGSTALEVGITIAEERKNIEVFSNNIPLVLYLAQNTSLPCHIVGGEYDRERAAATGEETARAIEGHTFDAAILTPRALSLVDHETAQASSFAVTRKLNDIAVKTSNDPEEFAQESLYFALYSMTPSQDPYKSALIKNATHLFIAADHHKIAMSGRYFFTIIVNELLRETRIRNSPHLGLAPVRTRGPVLMRRMVEEGVDAPVELRDPETVKVITTAEEDEPPAELVRLLRMYQTNPHFDELIAVAREVLVIVNSKGEAIDSNWVDEYVLR